jgi:hypothetical protein
VNQSRTVDANDTAALRPFFFQAVTAANFLADLTCDGAINLLDQNMQRANNGKTLAP